ncbi:MAG TPA: alkaline phosphatase family protein [Actinomycetota bacterium]|nr:alkaline phosphatase family protein [Actinomycetota bacterium]
MRSPQRVVYVVVDGMSTEAFEQAVGSGRAPAFSFLRDRARYVRDSVAVFPTITPCATASLVTGETPARHGIPGMCWYDRDAQRFVNYGQSPRAAVVEGVSQIVRDVLENLNSKHLSGDVTTIHEQLAALGLTTASINFMVFRGPVEHELDANLWQKLLFRRHLPGSIPGPKEHYFADVVSGPAGGCSKFPKGRKVEHRIRATDGWAACVTRELLEKRAADMILFYLHENDHVSHRYGPASQVDNLAAADEHLAYVLDSLGSWERTADEVGFVVTSDHSQSPVADDAEHVCDLTEILGDFAQVKPGRRKERFGDHDVAVAGNGRVGFVYLNEAREEQLRSAVVSALLEHPGTDQVMWVDGDTCHVRTGRGSLRFREAQGYGAVVDERGNKWEYEGDLGAIGGVVEEDGIRTPEYPLAMWRMMCALGLERMGDVVVTPKLTYEYCDIAGGHHRGGGDHASLHAQDSLVPFLSTLADPPLRPSTVDVVPHIVRHFEKLL